MKATKKEIDRIIANTNDSYPQLRGKEITGFADGVEYGSYMPSTANWSYSVWGIPLEGHIVTVAVRFGHIV